MDTGLPSTIGAKEKALWSVSLPKGNSSPIVSGGRLFLTGHQGDARIVLCYDAGTGKLIWRRSTAKARTETFNPLNGPTTPTPATDGQRVFVFFPEFGLIAYSRDGKELWKTPLGPFASVQGLASSPVYVDGKVILLVDTPEEAYLSAFDAETGKRIWRVDRPTGVTGSYATPTLYEPRDEGPQIVVAGAMELTGYAAATGERQWWAHGVTVFPTAPPFVLGDSAYTVEPVDRGWPPFNTVLEQFDKDKDGRVAISHVAGDPIWARSFSGIDRNVGNGDGFVTVEEYAKSANGLTGGGLIRTRIDGKGDVSNKNVVWSYAKGMPGMSGALLYQGVLYVIRNGIVTTFDPGTGALLRQERIMDALGEYYASPVAGDGKIYLASLDGKLTVLKAGADWQILSIADLEEQVIATPAVAESRIYIRTDRHLFCFGSQAKPAAAAAPTLRGAGNKPFTLPAVSRATGR